MNYCDYHVHSSFSLDSSEKMENTVKAAIDKGLKEIAFTEHMDLDFPEFYRDIYIAEMTEEEKLEFGEKITAPLFTFDVEKYLKEVERLRGLYGSRIKILTGMEMGMLPGRLDLVEKYRQLQHEYRFDITLASCHLVMGKDPYYADNWVGWNPDEYIAEYFKELRQCAEEICEYTSLAHLDYVVRYVPDNMLPEDRVTYFNNVYEKNKENIDSVLKGIIKRGAALEINTSGLFRGLGHAHPSESILNRYKELGGTKLTFGSDAHKACDVGRGIINYGI